MKWKILDTGVGDAEQNMAIDVALLNEQAFSSQPLLHLYEWKGPSATYGYFLNPDHHLNPKSVQKHQLQLARRPTGGGIIFHLWDFAFSVLIPAAHQGFSLNTLDNYAYVNGIAMRAIEAFSSDLKPVLLGDEAVCKSRACTNFCMAQPTKFDIVIDGFKVGGAAQRRTKHGLLHQGTIALGLPSDHYLNEMMLSCDIVPAMQQNSQCLLGKECTSKQLQEARNCFKALLIQTFQTFL